jgi:sugar phosphate isomerase/epimerase
VSHPSVSLQLYSVRDALELDIPATIERVAALGFTQVEASYKVLSRGPELLDAIKRNGLTSPTMTSPLLDADYDTVFSTAVALGAHTVIETFVPEEHWTTLDDVQSIADRLNAAAAKAAEFGLRVGYHNHWWELEHRFDGRTALDQLVDRLDPRVVLEVDAYWVAVGGVDPVEYVASQADRVRFLHLKDGPVTRDNKQQVPAGQGSMPLAEIIAAASNLEVVVVEFDDYAGDVFDAIAPAREKLTELVTA